MSARERSKNRSELGRRPSSRPRHKRGPGRKRKKTSAPLLRAFSLLFLLGLCAMSALFAWAFFGVAVANQEEPHQVQVSRVDKGEAIAELAQQGVLESPFLTRLYAQWLTPFAHFEPRAHLLAPGISARQLVQHLAELGGRPTAMVTFPEGFTHAPMAQRLEDAGICSAPGFREAVFDGALLGELGLPGPSAEGFLFPARYEFALDSDPRDVVRRLVKEANGRYATLVKNEPASPDLAKLGWGQFEVFTLASVVEKETSVESEAPRVARVFLNRLLFPEAETKGRLQSDPTAGYGCLIDSSRAPSCLKYKKQILPEMLADAKNPYNTYRHPGLPPGPIANPGERSLRAVLWPESGNDFYFVADGKGTHTFSATYEEHRRAVNALRDKRGRQQN